MKYIVYWFIIKMVSIPCPDQAYWEKIYGKGTTCAVAHFKNEKIKDSAWYWNRNSAYQKYLDLNALHESSCVMVQTSTNGEQPMYLFSKYVDISFDSIQLKTTHGK